MRSQKNFYNTSNDSLRTTNAPKPKETEIKPYIHFHSFSLIVQYALTLFINEKPLPKHHYKYWAVVSYYTFYTLTNTTVTIYQIHYFL